MHDIYLRFKSAELMTEWFLEWSLGNEILQSDIDKICDIFNLDTDSGLDAIEAQLEDRERLFAGIPESKWLELIISRPFFRNPHTPQGVKTVQDYVKLGHSKMKAILQILCAKHGYNYLFEFKKDLQRAEIKKILSCGYYLDSKGEKKYLLPRRKNAYLDKLIPDVINPTYFVRPENYIRALFNGLSWEQVWDIYYLNIRYLGS